MEYSLGDRGLRVISGRNVDDTGADSNGTGKSSLVMAALWCLTGRSDARTMVRSMPQYFQKSLRNHALFCEYYISDFQKSDSA